MTMKQEDADNSAIADRVDEAVSNYEWLERVILIGWFAKGTVYTLMGLTALQIARQDSAAEASPEGSVGRIAEAPFGRFLLAILAVGLVLYTVWRFLSVAVIRGTGVSQWADRAGYTFSGLFYLVLAYSASRSAIKGDDPAGSTSVETISTTLLDSTPGRWLLGVGGVVTIGIGLYFVVHKGLQRSFVKHLDSVYPALKDNVSKRNVMVVSGVIGWLGRGIVTGMVGFFVLRSAYRFDSDDARGFDRALREVAGTGIGSLLVFVSAIGLIVYGVFCFVTYNARSLEAP